MINNFWKILFFHPVLWNKLDPNLRSAASLSVFKKKFIRPSLFLIATTVKESNTSQDYALV